MRRMRGERMMPSLRFPFDLRTLRRLPPLFLRALGMIAALAIMTACNGGPFAPITMSRMTDADAYAIAFLDQLQPRSFATGREFCGLLGRDASGAVRATAPVMGHREHCTPGRAPENFNTFASYHTHGAFHADIDSEVPSAFDLVADREEGVIGYISTPGGRVWRSAQGRARLLCGPGCIAADPAYRPAAHAPIAPRYTADELRRRERGI